MEPEPTRQRRRDELRRRHQVRRRRAQGLAAVAGPGRCRRGGIGADARRRQPEGRGQRIETADAATVTGVIETGTGDSPPATTTTAAAPLTDVVIGWAGDMVPASATIALPSDPSILLAGVRDALSAPDVTMVNLEGTLTEGGDSKCGAGSSDCFAFRSPPSYATTFRKAGIDVVNHANNHAFDFGQSGYTDTRRAVRKAGLRSTGGPKESP